MSDFAPQSAVAHSVINKSAVIRYFTLCLCFKFSNESSTLSLPIQELCTPRPSNTEVDDQNDCRVSPPILRRARRSNTIARPPARDWECKWFKFRALCHSKIRGRSSEWKAPPTPLSMQKNGSYLWMTILPNNQVAFLQFWWSGLALSTMTRLRKCIANSVVL